MSPRERGTREERPLPQHPYRDSAILNAVLACALLLLAWLTGGELGRALAVAIGFFAIATAWNWWRFRQRIAARGISESPPAE